MVGLVNICPFFDNVIKTIVFPRKPIIVMKNCNLSIIDLYLLLSVVNVSFFIKWFWLSLKPDGSIKFSMSVYNVQVGKTTEEEIAFLKEAA